MASEISFFTLKMNLHVFIKLLVDLISKSPSSHRKFTLLVCSRHADKLFPAFPPLGSSLPLTALLFQHPNTLWEGSKVDNGQQSNFTAPASDRHRVILGGTLSILLSAYPQEHSELNQTLISPLL